MKGTRYLAFTYISSWIDVKININPGGYFYGKTKKTNTGKKGFFNSLLEHYQPKDAGDVQEMLKDLLGDTLQGMLEAEMDTKLGYSKYDYQNKGTDAGLFLS